MPTDALLALQNRLGHHFGQPELLIEALRHSSFVNEHSTPRLRDNERLEFLGDAVVNLIVGLMLMEHYPNSSEGELSRMRANLVNERQLACIAASLMVGDNILLGKGEAQDSGHRKNSILADALEAIVAAVFLDGGFDAAARLVRRHFAEVVEGTRPEVDRDHKSRLQELVQSAHQTIPCYRVLGSSGPDHAKVFEVELQINDLVTRGSGKSKKAAEQDAARRALSFLGEDETP
jgi:ribonuclease-3